MLENRAISDYSKLLKNYEHDNFRKLYLVTQNLFLIRFEEFDLAECTFDKDKQLYHFSGFVWTKTNKRLHKKFDLQPNNEIHDDFRISYFLFDNEDDSKSYMSYIKIKNNKRIEYIRPGVKE